MQELDRFETSKVTIKFKVIYVTYIGASWQKDLRFCVSLLNDCQLPAINL